MKKSYCRSFLAVALLLTASCENSPTGPGQNPNPIVQPDDTNIVIRFKVGPSQLERSTAYFSTLEVKELKAGETFSVSSDGVLTFKLPHSTMFPALSIGTKDGAEPFFCPMLTESQYLVSGEYEIHLVPIKYEVDGGYGSMSSCEHVEEGCTVQPSTGAAFYPVWVCGVEGSTREAPWKHALLSFDSSVPAELRYEVVRLANEAASIAFGPGEWFRESDGKGIKVFIDLSMNPNRCGVTVKEVSDGVAVSGSWGCGSLQALVSGLLKHEAQHVYAYSHIDSRPSVLNAECEGECEIIGWHFYPEDISSFRMEMEYRKMYHSGEKPLGSLDAVLRALRQN